MRWLAFLLLLASATLGAVEEYGYKVLEQRPHSRSDWVQGLELHDGRLYQGTGIKGRSRLQVLDFASDELLLEKQLPRKYFGEGITVLGDHIYQLTWRAGRGFIFRRPDLALLGEFRLPGEGWGLANDGQRLLMSDGSSRLWYLSPDDGRVLGSLQVTDEGQPVHYLNELEWTPDYLLANVWQSDRILMIDLPSGKVIGRIDMTGLLPARERRSGTDVLNGIARDSRSGDLWVTGKNWPWLYRIELIPKTRPGQR